MDKIGITAGSKILLLWGSKNTPETVKDSVNSLTQRVGSEGAVLVENVERLLLCKYPKTTPCILHH